MNLFDELASCVAHGEGLSFEATECLLDNLIAYANEQSTLAGIGFCKTQIKHRLNQYRDVLVYKAYEYLIMDMDELVKLVSNLDKLSGLPDTAVALLKQAQRFGEIPAGRASLYEIVFRAAEDYKQDELVELLANKLTEV